MRVQDENSDPWSVILAGGEGERLQPFVRRWLGYPKPKQYCTFIGTRSMFQHTLDRADLVGTPQRRVTVIAQSHEREALLQLGRRSPGRVIVQPANRDTAAGIFLPLTQIRACDPQATVVFYPSDHFVYPEERFAEVVHSAVRVSHLMPNHLILLGVSPEGVEPDYGWIEPGLELGWMGKESVHAVKTFLEKPDPQRARKAMRSGALWNTLVFVAQADALWTLGRLCFPDIMPLFERYGAAIGTPEEEQVLESLYQSMPPCNFSSGLLQRVPELVATIELREVLWCDWGRPERIVSTLSRIGKHPAFPMEHMEHAVAV